MQTGTQILIDRMKTNPEEFREGSISRWAAHIQYAMEYMPEEDKQALREAMNERRIGEFNERVLRELAGEIEPEKEEWLRYQAKERYAKGWSDPRGIFGNAIPKGEGHIVLDELDAQAYITATGRK